MGVMASGDTQNLGNGLQGLGDSPTGRRGVGVPVEVGAARAAQAARRAAVAALGDRIAEQAYQLDAALHRLLTDLREFDASGAWAEAGAASCAAWLAWRVGWDPGTAREHVRVARALGGLPQIDAALEAGRLSYSKVRAITRVATPATEAALLEDALATTAAQLERICRGLGTVQRLGRLSGDDVQARRSVVRREREDGMVVIEAVLPPDEAATVWAALAHEAARAEGVPAETAVAIAAGPVTIGSGTTGPGTTGPGTTGPGTTGPGTTGPGTIGPGTIGPGTTGPTPARRVDGLVAMCEAALRGDTPARAPVELVLTISREALAATGRVTPSDPAAVGVFADGTAIAAETARRLACDCGVVAVREDGAGQPLSVGRKTRSIPPAIARALARRDVTCRFPGCTSQRFLAGHHLQHWIHGGETALGNLCRLCPTHHRFVHEHGYQVTMEDGAPVFHHRGRRIDAEPPRGARAARIDATRAWAAIRRDGATLTIDATTGQCAWDGRAVDYAAAVASLVTLEARAHRAVVTG